MGLLTPRKPTPPKVVGSAPPPPNAQPLPKPDDAFWLQLQQDLKGLRTSYSDIAAFLQRIEQRMENRDFVERTIRVPSGSEPYPFELPEGTAGIVVSAPSGSNLDNVTIHHGIHVYTPNANSNPVFIPTTRTVREVIFYNSGTALVPVNVTALGYAAAQMWTATNGNVSLTGSKSPDLYKVFQDETGMSTVIAAGTFANVSTNGGIDTSAYASLAGVVIQITGTSPSWGFSLLQQYATGIYGPSGSPGIGNANGVTAAAGTGLWSRGQFAPGAGQYIQVSNGSSTNSLTVTAVYHEGWAQ